MKDKHYCMFCGKLITDHGIKYCPECRRKRKRKRTQVLGKAPSYAAGYGELIRAICKQAFKDYFTKRWHDDAVRFFYSEKFSHWTGYDGDRIMGYLHDRENKKPTH